MPWRQGNWESPSVSTRDQVRSARRSGAKAGEGEVEQPLALLLVAQDLDLGQSDQAWVVDAYALPFAALPTIAGALGDRYGRRGALLVGIAIFGVGSLLSAFAGRGGELFAWRAVTGVGAALIMPGTLSTITSVFPVEARARAVGIRAGFAMGGGTLGVYTWWRGQDAAPAVATEPEDDALRLSGAPEPEPEPELALEAT